MLKRSFLLLFAAVICSALVMPAMAKKKKDFDPTDIGDTGISSVDKLSEKTEALATKWSGPRDSVAGIPAAIGTAVGGEIDNVEAAVAEIAALQLPLKVDVVNFSVSIDQENLDEKQAAVAAALEEVVAEVSGVPAASVELGEAAVALGEEAVNLSQTLPGEIQSNPMLALKGPKAIESVAQQVEWLTTNLPEEIKLTGDTMKAFFEGLAAAAGSAAE